MSNTTLTPGGGGLGLEQQQTVAAPSGAATFGGIASNVAAGLVAAVGAVALALTTFAPTLAGRIGGGAGAASISGAPPVVSTSGAKVLTPGTSALIATTHLTSPVIVPGTATLLINGNSQVANTLIAPSAAILLFSPLGQGGVVIPGAAALALAGGVAPFGGNILISPASASTAVAGQGLLQFLAVPSPTAAPLSMGGTPPLVQISVNVTLAPAPGPLGLTGSNAFVSVGLAPSSGTATLSGAVPIVGTRETVAGYDGVIASDPPTLSISTTIVPTWATLSISGSVSQVSSMVTPAAGVLGLTPSFAIANFGPTIIPGSGALTTSSNGPTVATPLLVSPSAGAMTLTGGSIALNGTIVPLATALQLAGQSPLVAGQTITSSGSLGLASSAPLLRLTIAPPAAQINTAGAGAVLTANVIAVPAAAALSVTAQSVSISVTVNANPGAAGVALNGNAPTLEQTFNGQLIPHTGSLALAGLPAHVLQTVPTTTIFTDIVLLRAPVAGASLQGGPLPYGAAYQALGEQIHYGIDWEDWLALRWQPGTLVTAGQIIRPSLPNGYEFICLSTGETAGVEPGWPPFLGSTVLDGSAQWQCQVLSSDSLETSIQDINWSAGPGLSLTGNLLAGQASLITVDTTNAVAGMDYALKCVALMADGQQKVGTIIVKVR